MESERPCIYVNLEPYLAQWFINDFGGVTPIVLKKLSTERRILEVYLQKWPAAVPRDISTEGKVSIVIPDSRIKLPSKYNYLPNSAMNELKKCIRNRFVIQLWNDLHNFGYIGKKRSALIYAWMDSHGIELNDTNWNSIAKIYLRQHKNYLERELKKKKRNS